MSGAMTVTVQVLGDASSLEKTMSSVGPTTSAAMADLEGSAAGAGNAIAGVAGQHGKAKTAAEEHGKAEEETGGKLDKAGQSAKNLGGGMGTMLEAFAGYEVVKSLTEEVDKSSAAMAKLQTAMKNAGEKETPEFNDALDSTVKANERLGVAQGDTVDSIARLRQAGVDTATAMKDEAGIVDLSVAKHIDLASATDAVIGAMQGNGKALKALNVEMPPHLATTVQLDAATQALAKAKDAATTADQKQADAMAKAKAAFDAYGAAVDKFGENSKQAHAAQAKYTAAVKATDAAVKSDQAAHAKLEDAQNKVSKATADVNDRTKNLGDVMGVLHDKVGGDAAAAADTLHGKWEAIKVQFVDTGAKVLEDLMPALEKLLGGLGFLADHANIVIPIVGAMVAAFVAWKTAMLIASVIEAVTTAVGGLSAAMAFLAANPIVLVVVAVVALVAGLVILEEKFHFIERAAGAVFGWLKDNWPLLLDILLGPVGFAVGQIITHFDSIKQFVEDLPGHIGDVGHKIADALMWPWKTAFNAIADIWNNTVGKVSFSVPGWVPGIGGDGWGFPQMPKFHSGGVVPGYPGQEVPVLAMAGEEFSPAGRRGAGGGATTIHVHANTNADPHEIASEIMWTQRFRVA